MEECIDSATGQETQLAVLRTTERALYTVQSIRKVLHYDALQKEPESYGSVKKLREAGGMHRPELDGSRRNAVERTGNYLYRTGLGSVDPYSYPCRHVRASDLWCRRRTRCHSGSPRSSSTVKGSGTVAIDMLLPCSSASNASTSVTSVGLNMLFDLSSKFKIISSVIHVRS